MDRSCHGPSGARPAPSRRCWTRPQLKLCAAMRTTLRTANLELIGVDVGFSSRDLSSGVAHFRAGLLALDRADATWECRRGVLLEQPMADVTAIDAPVLPDAASLEPRSCERIFTLGKFQRRCKPGLSHVPGTGQQLREAGSQTADQLAAVTQDSETAVGFPRVRAPKNLVEAFPNAFLGVMLPEEAYDLTLPRFPGHLVKIHCRSRISGCGSCWQRGALSKRRWKSGVDFHGRVSFHS